MVLLLQKFPEDAWEGVPTCMRAFNGRRPSLSDCASGLAASCARALKSAALRMSIARSTRLPSSSTPPMPNADP